jgi:hypothetical protein
MALKLTTTMKLCPDCNIEKDTTEFITGGAKKPRCRPCENTRRREASKKKKEDSKNTTKICKECKTEKNGSEFEFGTLLCKSCFREQDKESNNRPSESDPDKTCRICNTTKSATMFRKKELVCKECNKAKLYKWREDNKERFLKICKNYRDKDEKKELRNKNRRERYSTDIKYRLEKQYRNRIHLCVKTKYVPKNTALNYTKLLGCSWEVFIKWLEFNMKPEMSIDNYGSYWHVDHTYPCSLFDFSIEAERYKCFNWTNLTPLEGLENIKKSNKLDIDLVKHYKDRAIEFIKDNSDIEILTDSLPDDIKLMVKSGALTTKVVVKAAAGAGEKSAV